MNITQRQIAAGLLLAFLLYTSQYQGCTIIPPARQVSHVSYHYEKDQGAVPREIDYALSWIAGNTEIATATIEDDKEPEPEYEAAQQHAKDKLPCLIVQGGGQILETWPAPTTVAEVNQATGLEIPEP